LGVGAIMPFQTKASLAAIIPRIQKRLALVSVLAYAVFMIISGYGILFSNLSLEAY
jgi:hypothetical protein